MNKYVAPELELVKLSVQNVILVSVGDEGSEDDNTTGGDKYETPIT